MAMLQGMVSITHMRIKAAQGGAWPGPATVGAAGSPPLLLVRGRGQASLDSVCPPLPLAASPPPLGFALGQIRQGRGSGGSGHMQEEVRGSEGTQDCRCALRWRPRSPSVGAECGRFVGY